MIATAIFRLRVSKSQHPFLADYLNVSKEIYNAANQEYREAIRLGYKPPERDDQFRSLTIIRRDIPKFKQYPLNLLRGAVQRLHNGIKAAKALKKKGYKASKPRYKKEFDSFTFNEFVGIRIKGNKLLFGGQSFKMVVSKSHPLPTTKIKMATLKKKNNKWYVYLTYEKPDQPYVKNGKVLGLDLGITHLATTSKGDHIENKRFYEKTSKKVKAIDQQLAKSKRGSKRRQKAKEKRARLLTKIANQRKTYLHKVSRDLVNKYDTIAIENLNITNMNKKKGRLGKQIADAGWAILINMISYKAESAGKKVEPVDPRNTSQMCSDCKMIVPKKRNEHHDCPYCGLVLDRDVNAARNIAAKAVEGLSGHVIDV